MSGRNQRRRAVGNVDEVLWCRFLLAVFDGQVEVWNWVTPLGELGEESADIRFTYVRQFGPQGVDAAGGFVEHVVERKG